MDTHWSPQVERPRFGLASLHRARVRVVEVTRAVVKALFADHAFDHAATMAFYFFLGSIPLLVVVGLLAGNLVQREGAQALAQPLLRTLPPDAAAIVEKELSAMGEADARTIAPLSVLGFLWLTTNGIHNLMDVFEQVLRAPPRPWWRQRLIATLWLAAFVVLLAVATWLVLLLNGATGDERDQTALPELFRHAGGILVSGWQRVGVLALFVAATAGGLAAFYRTATAWPRHVERHIWPGTLVAMILAGLVSWAFGTYVATITDYAVYYGSLATVAVMLLWLYLASLSVLVGAEVNAHLEATSMTERVA